MGDELIAGLPFLVGVVMAGEAEGAGDLFAIDGGAAAPGLGGLRLELLDDRDQVVKQRSLADVQPVREFAVLFDRLRNGTCSLCSSM